MRKTTLVILQVMILVSSCSSPPPSAEIVGEWQLEGYILSTAVAEIGGQPYLFTIDGDVSGSSAEATLIVYKLTEAIAPVEVGRLETPIEVMTGCGGLCLGGDRLYAALTGAEGSAVWVVDVSEPAFPQEAALIDTEHPVASPVVSGQYLYVFGLFSGVVVFDLSDPSNTRELGYFGGVGGGNSVISGSLIFTVRDYGLQIADVSSPSDVREVGFFANPGGVGPEVVTSGVRSLTAEEFDHFIDMAFTTDYAYIASGSSGLRVVDVSEPSSPREVKQIGTDGIAWGTMLSGKYLYLLSFRIFEGETPGAILLVLDVSEPAQPEPVDTVEFDSLFPPGGPVLVGRYLYVITPTGIPVLDVSDFQ